MSRTDQTVALVQQPVRVEVPARFPVEGSAAAAPAVAERVIAVDAVVPCYNRSRDLSLLLGDLAGLELANGHGPLRVRLRVLVVDNASDRPLEGVGVPQGLDVEFLRLPANSGGSGGFNAGLARILHRAAEGTVCRDEATNGDSRPRRAGEEVTGSGSEPVLDAIWLLDSDARVRPETLLQLVMALEYRPDLVAVGSAIADPATGRVFEVGGRVCRRNGRFEPVHRGAVGAPAVVECDYVAACSALVRRDAVERAGLMPDVFLNADDVEWFVRLARATGGRVAAVPASVVVHPTFDRFPTWARYYVARNSMGPMGALGLGRRARFRRAAREAARAVGQAMAGRDDLSALHLRGLRDALNGKLAGAAEAAREGEPALPFEPFHAMGSLAAHVIPLISKRARRVGVAFAEGVGLSEADRAELESQLAVAAEPYGGIERTKMPGWLMRILGDVPDIAVVAARGRPGSWLAGRLAVAVTPQGFVIRRRRALRTLVSAGRTGATGLWLAWRLAVRPPERVPAALSPCAAPDIQRVVVGVVVLSHNRWPALRMTLQHLIGPAGVDPASIVVVDNASSDGSADLVSTEFPAVVLLRSSANLGVEAFNRGVDHLLAGPRAPEAVLILDDDARPDPTALRSAADLLARRPDVGAVTLHPKHPASGASEWPFARAVASDGDDWWPVMGCANLVRTWVWRRVGGYERDYFLYRNDTDLALKLLAAGIPNHFNPAWVAVHDSPAAARKSERWHRLATRNWVWTMRRHGAGFGRVAAVMLGWAWAHRLGGISIPRQLLTVRGAVRGLYSPPPGMPKGLQRGGAREHVGRLVRLQLRHRRVR